MSAAVAAAGQLRTEAHRAPGLIVAEHTLAVPLDHANPDGAWIELFAREVADPDGRDRPALVFFQGGPGYEASRPTRVPLGPSWLDRALESYRVIFLDQRGTGRSAPVGSLPGMDAAAQAEYLTHFRADAIVRDAELLRAALGIERWSVLGQSFGGFCVVAYLSLAPEGLQEALIAGGLPTLDHHLDEVYRRTYRRVRERCRRHLARYPADRQRLRRLRELVEAGELVLPTGETLSWRRLRQLGSLLGMAGGEQRLHYVLELPPHSPAFAHDVDRTLGFARNPLYAALHEACWANGGATRWSAERLLPPHLDDDVELTGEHVYPWMFDEYAALAPLKEAAAILAEHDWPPLYDQQVLARNEVPAAAVVYAGDMYVEREFSERTARQIRGMRTWLTDEYEHDGLTASGGRVLGRLIDLARDRV